MAIIKQLGLDPNHANNEGRTALMGAAMKGRPDVIQMLVDRGANLATFDKGNRDTDKVSSAAAGKTWQAVDYALAAKHDKTLAVHVAITELLFGDGDADERDDGTGR